MSKFERRKANEIHFVASAITPRGEVILTRLELDPNPKEPANPYHITHTIDATDVIRIMRFLDEQGPLMRTTGSLTRATEDMRAALLDIFSVVKQESDQVKTHDGTKEAEDE